MVNTGYKQSLYYGNETIYGSTATVNKPIGLVQSVSPTETNTLIKVRTLGGTRDYSNIVPGKFEISGSFDYFLQGGAFLRQGMSEDSGTAAPLIDQGPRYHVSDTDYVHVMGSATSPTADSFPSFTLELTDDEDGGNPGTYNLKRNFTGCRVNQMTISGNVDEPVKVNVDWMAQGVNIGTGAPSSVSDYTVDPFVFYQGNVYATTGTGIEYDTAMSKVDDGGICEVNSFDFGVNNNLEATWYVCGTQNAYQTLRGLKNLLAKGRDYTSSLGLHFRDKTQYERFLGTVGATRSQGTLDSYTVVLDMVRAGAIGTKVTGDDYMRIVMSGVKFADINIAGSPEDIVSQDITLDIESAKLYFVDQVADYSS